MTPIRNAVNQWSAVSWVVSQLPPLGSPTQPRGGIPSDAGVHAPRRPAVAARDVSKWSDRARVSTRRARRGSDRGWVEDLLLEELGEVLLATLQPQEGLADFAGPLLGALARMEGGNAHPDARRVLRLAVDWHALVEQGYFALQDV